MIYLLIAMVVWSVRNVLMKIARAHLDSLSIMIWETAGIVIIGLISLAIFRPTIRIDFHFPTSLLVIAGGACGIIGTYTFLQALSKMQIAEAAPLSSLTVLITAILGMALLKETLTPTQMISGFVMIAAAVVFGLSSAR